MRFEIFDEKKVLEKEPVKLNLQEANGKISVITRNKSNILVINIDGTIRRSNCISSKVGFQLDHNGRVIDSTEKDPT